MVLLSTPECDRGWRAVDASLRATDGQVYRLLDLAGEKGLVVAFICNHCPYVIAVVEDMVSDAQALKELDIGFAAVCSNDAQTYPDDAFDKMGLFAQSHAFSFPYLHDADQSLARSYGAVCTPDFFGFDRSLALAYRGRLDDARPGQDRSGRKRELFEAMQAIAQGQAVSAPQMPSMGCSIKWKES